jgi:hypothetical protein
MESLTSLTPDERAALAATIAVSLYHMVGQDEVEALTLLLISVVGILDLMALEVNI